MTPLWDIPDEFGHFSYIRDIAEGKGVPVHGRAKIGADVMSHVYRSPDVSPFVNWIAQHPPVYHLLAAIPYKIGNYFTNNAEILYRLPRLISVLSGALLLLVIFKTIHLTGLDKYRSTVVAASVGFIPMVSHLSSGTNHDVTLFLFCALATYYFSNYLIRHKYRDAYLCALWLSVAGGTKMTAWVFLAPMVVILIVEMPGPIKSWVRHAAGISILALSIPLAWMLRNVLYFGNPFHTSDPNTEGKLGEALGESFFEYLYLQPVFEQLLNHFYGLIGWMGTGGGKVKLLTVHGLPFAFFSILIFCLAFIFVLYVILLSYRTFRLTHFRMTANSIVGWAGSIIEGKKCYKAVMIISFFAAILISGYIGMISYAAPTFLGVARIITVVLLIFGGIVSFALLFLSNDPVDRIALYGVVLFLFFGSFLLYKVYSIYLVRGQLGAMHGRYFYPVIPALLLSFSIALKRLRVPIIAIAIFVTFLACMEIETIVMQAIPFYIGNRP